MKKIILLLVLLIIMLTSRVLSQEKQEDVPIKIFDKDIGMVSLNQDEKKVSIRFSSYPKLDNRYLNIGVGAYAKANNSYSSIFQQGYISPGAGFNLFGAIRICSSDTQYLPNDTMAYCQLNFSNEEKDKKTEEYCKNHPISGYAKTCWLYVNGGVDASLINIFDLNNQNIARLEEKYYNSYFVDLGLNCWIASLFGLPLETVFSASVGYKLGNNFDDLEEILFQESVIINGYNQTYTANKSRTAYCGNFKTFDSYPLKFNVFFKPTFVTNFGINLLLNQIIKNNDSPSTNVGFGIYFLKNNNPLDPLYGISFKINDFDKYLNNYGGFQMSKKLSIGITTRIDLFNL